MALYTTLASLSQNPALNAPDGSTDAPSTLDDQDRLLGSFIAMLRDGVGFAGATSNRNKLINATGSVNQRGYSSGVATVAANQYTVDRWRIPVLGEALNWTTSGLDKIFTAPAGGCEQVIEGANLESGTYFLSWTGTATAKVAGVAVANGGSAVVVAGTDTVVQFAGGTFTLPQFARGSVSEFERRPYAQELAACQRYLPVWQAAPSQALAVGQCLGSGSASVVVNSPVQTRVAPTGLVSSGNSNLTDSGGNALAVTAFVFSSATVNTMTIAVGTGGGLVAGNATVLLGATPSGAFFYGTGCEL